MRFTLAALASMPIAFACMAVQAQAARYCDGKIVATAVYSTVEAADESSVVTYHIQLKTTGEATRYAVQFQAPNTAGALAGRLVARLPSDQQVDIILGRQRFANPTGAGQLGPMDILRYTAVRCPA